MKASLQALDNIAREMKKKGIQKISMIGKTDPNTLEKMKSMEEPTDSEDSMDTEPKETMSEDKEEDAVEGEDTAFKDRLDLVRKILRGQ